jgi:hypothetical protein
MTDTNELPDDLASLKQLVAERDATLEAMHLALRQAQLHIDQLALLLRKSGGTRLVTAARGTFTHGWG